MLGVDSTEIWMLEWDELRATQRALLSLYYDLRMRSSRDTGGLCDGRYEPPDD